MKWSDLSWASDEAFLLLWLVAALAVGMLVVSYWRAALVARLGEPELVSRLMSSCDVRKRLIKNVLILLGAAFAVVAMAGPQTFSRRLSVAREGSDLVVVLDSSLSMLAEDIKPNRFERVRAELADLIRRVPVDRIALVAFSGGTQELSPLSSDRSLIVDRLEQLDPAEVPVKGTALAAGMQAGIGQFYDQHRKSKLMLLISDGEDTNPLPIHLAERAKREGIELMVVGVGMPDGNIIPVKGPDDSGSALLDSQGRVVRTQLNEELLGRIAEAASGTYWPVYSREKRFSDQVVEMAESARDRSAFQDVVVAYDSRYQWPLCLALLLITAEIMISERRKPS